LQGVGWPIGGLSAALDQLIKIATNATTPPMKITVSVRDIVHMTASLFFVEPLGEASKRFFVGLRPTPDQS
jgi:hypothetical protein